MNDVRSLTLAALYECCSAAVTLRLEATDPGGRARAGDDLLGVLVELDRRGCARYVTHTRRSGDGAMPLVEGRLVARPRHPAPARP